MYQRLGGGGGGGGWNEELCVMYIYRIITNVTIHVLHNQFLCDPHFVYFALEGSMQFREKLTYNITKFTLVESALETVRGSQLYTISPACILAVDCANTTFLARGK